MTQPTHAIVRSVRGVVASGHSLASEVGIGILRQGGNAIDAAAAMCFCLNVLEPDKNGIGGEVPTLVHIASEKKTYAICGMGWSPHALTIEWCRANNISLIPSDGYISACVPSVVGTWAMVVARWGKLSFEEILQPAIELSEKGFAVYESLAKSLRNNERKFNERYPTTGKIYLREGKAPSVGDVLRNNDFSRMLRMMCDAERSAKTKGRIAGIEAARNVFYEGEIAAKIVDFVGANPVRDAKEQTHSGLLSRSDFADWHATYEAPISYDYHGYQVHKCGAWTQGPVFLQQLALLKAFDLKKLKHNSADYLHLLIEVAKLAFADREAYYGDPMFDDVPLDNLLSDDYNDARRNLIGEDASDAMRPGDTGRGVPNYATQFDVIGQRDHNDQIGVYASNPLGDTTHLDVIDHEGNVVASTPSGGWIGTSPVIEGLGFSLGTRAQMFYLNPNRPNALEPRKRPRATLTPTIVEKKGEPMMAFGTPGGDGQDQWTLQFFLNVIEFGMDIQSALDAPTFTCLHFPSSFYPREAYPKRIEIEDRIESSVIEALRTRGHDVHVIGGWRNGKPMCAMRDRERDTLLAAVTARGQIGYAKGW